MVLLPVLLAVPAGFGGDPRSEAPLSVYLLIAAVVLWAPLVAASVAARKVGRRMLGCRSGAVLRSS